jgi:hypothetical protein
MLASVGSSVASSIATGPARAASGRTHLFAALFPAGNQPEPGDEK